MARHVTVSNPGGRPEMHWAASALARRSMLQRYYTSLAFDPDGHVLGRAGTIPGPLRRRIEGQARLRQYPPAVTAEQVSHCAVTSEIALYALRGTWLSRRYQREMFDIRGWTFDRAVSRRLERSDVFLTVYHVASRSMLRARELGVVTVLAFPVAHHSWSKRLLDEEARMKPEFAQTLQYPAGGLERNRRLLDLELQRADRVLAYSSFHASTLVREGIEAERILVAPLGVDLELFRPRPKAPRDSGFTVLFVGQIGQRKGLSYLIEGFDKAAIPNSELVLVGSVVGTDEPWRGHARIRHIPHVPRHELPDLYSKASVFVMPSLVEGFCQTPLEALACGLPAIVTPNTFGDEVVRDGVEGWNVPMRDADAIAERLATIASDPVLRERMAVAAHDRAQEYSWDHFGEVLSSQLARL